MKRAWVGWWGTTILGIVQRAFLDAKMSLEESERRRKKKKEKGKRKRRDKDNAEAQRSQSQRRE